MKLRVYQKYTFFCLYEHETHPPSPSLKAKGRVGVGLRKKK